MAVEDGQIRIVRRWIHCADCDSAVVDLPCAYGPLEWDLPEHRCPRASGRAGYRATERMTVEYTPRFDDATAAINEALLILEEAQDA